MCTKFYKTIYKTIQSDKPGFCRNCITKYARRVTAPEQDEKLIKLFPMTNSRL